MSSKEKLLRYLVKFFAKLYYSDKFGNKKELSYIPPSGKVLDFHELSYMLDASMDMWLTTGRFNIKFEKLLTEYFNVNHVLTVNSGSSANLLALSALTSHLLGDRQIKHGDEIITVAACFPTTVNPAILLGMVPVFVDCEIGSYNINIEQIEEAITPKTKAIIIAHTLGNAFNLDAVKAICDKHNLWLIEDACDAFGTKYKDKFVGTIGDIGTYSCYPAHIITTGEGGIVVTNNSKLNKILRSFRDWGRDCWCEPGQDNSCNCRFKQQLGNLPWGYDHKYTYSHIGYNLKITDWQAAIGIAQMAKINQFIAKRSQNFNSLYDKLADLQQYLILPTTEEGVEPAWFGFLISVKQNAGFSKQELVEYLEKNGVGTRQLFAGNILRQPYFVFNDIALKIRTSDIINSNALTEDHYKLLPNTDFIMNNTFWVGVYPALEEKDLEKISAVIHDFVGSK